MDTHSAYLTGTNRSRSSQTPSPSHSASASATSSIHKRKLASEDHVPPFPPSFSPSFPSASATSRSSQSISARGGGADSDSDDDSDDAVVEDDEDDFDNDSSMRNFTAARLENSGAAGSASASASASAARTTKIKSNATVKIENSNISKDGVTAGGTNAAGPTVGTTGNSVSGIVVKEDTSKIFADSIQTSGAYISREESLKREVCLLDQTVLLYFGPSPCRMLFRTVIYLSMEGRVRERGGVSEKG